MLMLSVHDRLVRCGEYIFLRGTDVPDIEHSEIAYNLEVIFLNEFVV